MGRGRQDIILLGSGEEARHSGMAALRFWGATTSLVNRYANLEEVKDFEYSLSVVVEPTSPFPKAPASDGASAISSYTATYTVGNVSVQGMTSGIIVKNLKSKGRYTLTVTATNVLGTSFDSLPAEADAK
jgi:hypothetical protein